MKIIQTYFNSTWRNCINSDFERLSGYMQWKLCKHILTVVEGTVYILISKWHLIICIGSKLKTILIGDKETVWILIWKGYRSFAVETVQTYFDGRWSNCMNSDFEMLSDHMQSQLSRPILTRVERIIWIRISKIQLIICSGPYPDVFWQELLEVWFR